MRVKLGPVTLDYAWTSRLDLVDAEQRMAVVAVEGRESHGQGAASATIQSHLIAEGEKTRVHVETDVTVSGRPAQFGRGIMQDVSVGILDDFARRLSRLLAERDAVAGDAPAPESR